MLPALFALGSSSALHVISLTHVAHGSVAWNLLNVT